MSPLENLIYLGLLSMFGNNIILLSLVGLLILVGIILLFHNPMSVTFPSFLIVGLMFSDLFPPIIALVVIVSGTIIATFLYSIIKR